MVLGHREAKENNSFSVLTKNFKKIRHGLLKSLNYKQIWKELDILILNYLDHTDREKNQVFESLKILKTTFGWIVVV